MRMKSLVSVPLLAATLALTPLAHADLQDEVQVYDDSINKPGTYGLELHVNTTPSGRSSSNYPGEVPPRHAIRITPEFSYGLSRDLEAGLYVPTLLNAEHHYDVAGAKLRLKWLPLQTVDGAGWFGGANLELSRLAKRYSESRTTLETRFIAGIRTSDWLLALNPTLGFNLSDGLGGQRPALSVGAKLARNVAEGVAVGLEYYTDTGPLGRRLPWQQQDNRLYLAFDIDRKPWTFNVGIGRGLTDAADRLTLKFIFEIPLPEAGIR